MNDAGEVLIFRFFHIIIDITYHLLYAFDTKVGLARATGQIIAFLNSDDVDAAVADGPTAIDIVKANPEMELTVLDGVYTEESYGIAVNMEQTELLALINEGLAAVQADGTYDEIYDTWFSVDGGGAGMVYKVGTNAEYPPFENVDEAGEIVGFDVDLLTAVADAAGFEFEWVNTRWDGIFVALQSGEFDAVISAATITDRMAPEKSSTRARTESTDSRDLSARRRTSSATTPNLSPCSPAAEASMAALRARMWVSWAISVIRSSSSHDTS